MNYSKKIGVVFSLAACAVLQASAETIPVAGLNRSARPTPTSVNSNGEYYVIMGIYRLFMGVAYHGTVITCPRWYFTSDEQRQLDDLISGYYWAELNQDWWSRKTDDGCKLIEFGGDGGSDNTQCDGISSCDDSECTSSTGTMQSLSSLYSNFQEFDSDSVWKYIYGTGSQDTDGVKHDACDQSIPSGDINWSPHCYSAVFGPNCNTFVSFVLKCVYKVDACEDQCMKPYIGASDPMSIQCDGSLAATIAQNEAANTSIIV